MRRSLLALALIAATPACYTTTVSTNRPMGTAVHTQKSHIFIGGLIGGHVEPPCDPAQIVAQQTFIDVVLSTVTIGLYTPFTVRTTCANSGAVPTSASRP